MARLGGASTAARVALVAVAGACAVFVILSATFWAGSDLESFVVTGPVSALGWWCALRSDAVRDHGMAAALLPRRGNLPATAVSSDTWESMVEAVPPEPFQTDRWFAARRGRLILAALFTASLAWLAVAAGGVDNTAGEPSRVAVFGHIAFGGLALLTVRLAVKLLTARWGLRVQRERLVLGPPLGHWLPASIERHEIAAIQVDPYRIVLLLTDRRVHEVSISGLRDRDDIAAALHPTQTLGAPATDRSGTPPPVNEPGSTDLLVRKNQPSTVPPLPPLGFAPGTQPSPEDIAGATQQWRRERRLGLLYAGLAVVLIGSAVFWWDIQRRANDDLLEHGVVVVATVIDVQPRAAGSLTVRFSHGGETFTRDLHSGPLSGYASSNLDRRITILFDPSEPDLIREPRKANIHNLTVIPPIIGLFPLLFSSLSLSRSRHALRLLADTTWTRCVASLRRSERRTPHRLEVRLANGVPITSNSVRGVRNNRVGGAAFCALDGRWLLVVSDGSRGACLAKIGLMQRTILASVDDPTASSVNADD